MNQRSGVLQWQDDMGRWSGWTVCTNSLQSTDIPGNYATIDMLSNADSTNSAFSSPDNGLLDSLKLNIQGISGISSANSAWAYHLVHCVWYAVGQNEIAGIKAAYTAATDKSNYTIRYSQAAIFNDMPANVSAIHEGTSTGWVANQGNLELFVEKFGTAVNITGPSGSIVRPVRSTPGLSADPTNIYAFNYSTPTTVNFIPASQLIGIRFRTINGIVLWRPMTAALAYVYGQTTKTSSAQVTYTGRTAFVGQTGTWKLARSNLLWNSKDAPNAFSATLKLYQTNSDNLYNMPPITVDGYQLPAGNYWALHSGGSTFYEVDRESYIRIQQASETRVDPWLYANDPSTGITNATWLYSTPGNSASTGTEILWERVPNRTAQPQINSIPYRLQTTGTCLDTNPANIFGASSALAAFNTAPNVSDLLFTWNRGSNKWEAVAKDHLAVGTYLVGSFLWNKPFGAIGVRVYAAMDALLQASPTLATNLNLATQANNQLQGYMTSLNALNAPSTAPYLTAAQTAAQKLTNDSQNISNYANQVSSTITYYNNTPFLQMSESQITSVGSQVSGWLKLVPEILQDIQTQLAVVASLVQVATIAQNSSSSGPDPAHLQAEIATILAQITAINSQIRTALAEVNNAVDRGTAAQASISEKTNISTTDSTNIATIISAMQNAQQTAQNAKTNADNILTTATALANTLTNSTDTNALASAVNTLQDQKDIVIQDQATALNTGIAATSSITQLEQITLRIILTPAPKPSLLQSLSAILLAPFQIFWAIVQGVWYVVSFPFVAIWNLIANLFSRK